MNLSAMKKLFLLLFFSISSMCFADKIKHVISLGPNCIPAGFLSHNGLRYEAFPLDWMMTHTVNGIHQALEEDFLYLFDPNYLVFHHGGVLVNKRYNFEMNHLFDNESNEFRDRLNAINFINFLDPVHETFNRRIQRLLNTLNGSDQVFFFRLAGGETDTDEVILLRNLLISKYPLLDFVIIFCSMAENPYSDESNIQFFQIEHAGNLWQNQISHPQWTKILKILNLI